MLFLDKVDCENFATVINWLIYFIKIKSKMTVWQLMFWSFLLSNSTEECVVVGKKDVLYSVRLVL